MSDPTFWKRKQLLAERTIKFPLRHWWDEEGLSEIEQIYFEAIRRADRLLDVGAGNLRMKRKFQGAGYSGIYDTLDIGQEYSYTYTDLSQVTGRYGAILFLDVIEHLPLNAGLQMLDRLCALLSPGGVLVVQTPNARCVRNPLSWDMTHLHCYNGGDLWAYLQCRGFETQAYRVVFNRRFRSPVALAGSLVSAFFITRILGCDYADNIALVATKDNNVQFRDLTKR